jgi:hypothetical protein
MRLQQVQHISKDNFRNDVVLGDRPLDPLVGPELLGQPFTVTQHSPMIYLFEAGHLGRHDEFRKVRRKRGNGQKTDVYVYNDNGIPDAYFIEVT